MLERPHDIQVLREIKLELRQELLEAFAVQSIRQITEVTGLHHNDISYLQTDAKLNRFTVDRMLLILIALRRRTVITVELPQRAAE